MVVKQGQKGFVQLGADFAPLNWREALIINVKKEDLELLVRCEKSEIEKSGLSCVEMSEKAFGLVEAKVSQLRLGVAGSYLDLKVDPKELLKLGQAMLDSDQDLNYATASDMDAVRTSQKHPRKKSHSSSTDSSGEEDGQDALAALRSSWLGSGSTKDKPEKPQDSSSRRKKRFSLLEKQGKGRGNQQKEPAEAALEAALKTSDPLQGLLALQLMQTMKDGPSKSRGSRSKKERSCSSSSGTDLESDSSDSDKDLRNLQKGHSLAVKNYQKAGKHMFRHPLKHVKRFVKKLEKDLGAEDRAFRIVDANRKINFGKQRNLQRCHYLVCLILEWLLKEEPEKAALQSVLTLQAIHQCAEHARACQDNRKFEAKGRRKGRNRSEREGKGEGQEWPRQAQAQGQQGELCRHLRPQPEVETPDEPAKPGKSCSVLDSLKASWGSFGRFLKLLNTSKQSKRSGPRTPPKPCREDHLFPSLLVIPESNGKPSGARSRARRRDRDEA